MLKKLKLKLRILTKVYKVWHLNLPRIHEGTVNDCNPLHFGIELLIAYFIFDILKK
ncbi:hypothetical protein ACS0TY_026265 [Phlomoides rotata]